MSNESTDLNKKLKMGVDAARAGQKSIAQVHLNAVLQLDPNNIPAMFWLAYVSTSAQESVRLFERILELDPNNERAKAGMQWARGRLSAEAVSTEQQDETSPHPLTDGHYLRQQALSGKSQKARKGVLAHRARRTIDSMTVLFILAGVLTIIALGLGALMLVPQDTLAAWLPVSTPNADIPAADIVPQISEPPAAPALPVVMASPTIPLIPNLASYGDTLDIQPPVDAQSNEAAASTLPIEIESNVATEASTAPPQEPVFIMPNFIGPQIPSAAPEIPVVTEAVSEPPLEEFPVSLPVDNTTFEMPPAQPLPAAPLSHQPAYPGEKWIEVNVTTQQVTAWEGDVPVMSYVVSTGLPNTPTVLGEYNIYWKLESTVMSGADYYLPDVPYTMYFHGGYALHGTYWHNSFGQPMSHGCVNLETGNAQTLFEWAGPVVPPGQAQVTATADNPGTLVVVHQ